MSDRHEWLDDALRVAAAEDSRTSVPPHVEARVMRSWDDRQAAAGTPARHRSRRSAWIAAGMAAACVVAFVIPRSRPAQVQTHAGERQFPAQRQEDSGPAAAATPVDGATETPLGAPPRQAAFSSSAERSARGETRRPAGMLVDRGATELVLVPEPAVDPAALQVVRVRMSRTAFASLGVPIENPDADALVEVEMIVGDDGVARSIRRAAFISDVGERGAR